MEKNKTVKNKTMNTLILNTLSLSLLTELEEYAFSLNTVWVLISAALVFFMQAGFALVEAGFTRAKNSANILFKNLKVERTRTD